jgi:hypothetical protein
MSEIEKKEISTEILKEWYSEKGIDLEEPAKAEEQKLAPPQFSFSQKAQEETADEESKKLLVKRQIKQLLAIAEKQGLEQSIKEAQKANDPFLLDIYHDVLAKDGSYKKIINK